MSDWRDDIRPGDLPGDLALVAQELGMDTAIRLAERFGGVHIYVRKADGVLYEARARWVRANSQIPAREAALAAGLSERQVYRIREGEREDAKGPALPFGEGNA